VRRRRRLLVSLSPRGGRWLRRPSPRRPDASSPRTVCRLWSRASTGSSLTSGPTTAGSSTSSGDEVRGPAPAPLDAGARTSRRCGWSPSDPARIRRRRPHEYAGRMRGDQPAAPTRRTSAALTGRPATSALVTAKKSRVGRAEAPDPGCKLSPSEVQTLRRAWLCRAGCERWHPAFATGAGRLSTRSAGSGFAHPVVATPSATEPASRGRAPPSPPSALSVELHSPTRAAAAGAASSAGPCAPGSGPTAPDVVHRRRHEPRR